MLVLRGYGHRIRVNDGARGRLQAIFVRLVATSLKSIG
jgi:hypothetical protein